MLKELLGEKFQIIEEVVDWKDAIVKSAYPLLLNDSIEERYIEAMIQMCEEYNAYIVLMDYFAMPHAAPKFGSKKLDAALTIVKKPVDFLGKEVHVLLTIAFTDNQSHLALLQEVAMLMGEKKNLDALIQANDINEIAEIVSIGLKD